MDTQIIAAIISAIGQVIPACITACFGVFGIFLGAYLTNRLSKVEQNTRQTEQTIEKISDSLPSLRLLLEHDENGNPLNGNTSDLIDAVLKGYPIKIVIHHPDKVTQVINAESSYIDNGIVFASNTNEISVTKDETGDLIYQDKPYHYLLLVGINGSFHQKRVYMDGTHHKTTKIKRRMTWIGLIPTR